MLLSTRSRPLEFSNIIAARGDSYRPEASNIFELAVPTAIVLFGFGGGASLAAVVSVLIEVTFMLFFANL
jgi:hypothetical protein